MGRSVRWAILSDQITFIEKNKKKKSCFIVKRERERLYKLMRIKEPIVRYTVIIM